MSKYFIIGTPPPLSQEENEQLQAEKAELHDDYWRRRNMLGQINIDDLPHIDAPPNRIIIAVDMNKKETHRMENGQELLLARKFDNFDRKYTEPVNAIVISGGDLPRHAEIIIHHNATHDVNRLFNIKGLETNENLRYFSILEGQAYLYREMGSEEWKACKGFATGLRLFKPYKGILEGVAPTPIKDKLYITSGALKGNVVLTLKACDYEMVFQGLNGREQRIIRCRHFGTEEYHEREEIIGIDAEATAAVNADELYLGLNTSDCKPLSEIQKV